MRASLLSFLVLAAAFAQDTPRRPSSGPPFVRASGDAVVEVKPDQAIINIGVVTQAPTAAAAASQNAAQTQAVLDKIKGEAGARADIRTVGYSVNPNYRYPNPPAQGEPKIAGYSAQNTVRVTLNDIAMAGRLLDLATSAGANNVNGIQFTLKDEQAARTRALRQAAQNARASAEAMAAALGLKVAGVASAETADSRPIHPVQNGMVAMARAAPAPVETGTIEVRATVTVTLYIAP